MKFEKKCNILYTYDDDKSKKFIKEYTVEAINSKIASNFIDIYVLFILWGIGKIIKLSSDRHLFPSATIHHIITFRSRADNARKSHYLCCFWMIINVKIVVYNIHIILKHMKIFVYIICLTLPSEIFLDFE